jgi:hypothetical protein
MIYDLFTDMLISGRAIDLIGLSRVLEIVGKAAGQNLASEDANLRMRQFVAAVAENEPDDFQDAFAVLGDTKRDRLASFMHMDEE